MRRVQSSQNLSSQSLAAMGGDDEEYEEEDLLRSMGGSPKMMGGMGGSPKAHQRESSFKGGGRTLT